MNKEINYKKNVTIRWESAFVGGVDFPRKLEAQPAIPERVLDVYTHLLLLQTLTFWEKSDDHQQPFSER